MIIVNLTPHEVSVVLTHSRVIYPISSCPARVEVSTKRTGMLKEFIPVFETVLGKVIDLPAANKNTFLIVSRMVKSACPERLDLLVPSGLVRDDNGVIIGCRGFE